MHKLHVCMHTHTQVGIFFVSFQLIVSLVLINVVIAVRTRTNTSAHVIVAVFIADMALAVSRTHKVSSCMQPSIMAYVH